jgi:transaldolase
MAAEPNPAQRLHALGQSLWLDSINRVMLRSGALARYVSELAVTGLTSNPTILGHAMAAGSDYDRSLARLVAASAAAERTIAAIAEAGVDVDILAERLQRQGAGAFGADWAALLAAIRKKAGEPETGSTP